MITAKSQMHPPGLANFVLPNLDRALDFDNHLSNFVKTLRPEHAIKEVHILT